MEIIKLILTFGIWFLIILILDYVWLGIISKNFIIKEFKNLVIVENWWIKVNIKAWVIAWSLIVLWILFFITINSNNIIQATYTGVLFWLILYWVYDLTNLTFIKEYPIKFVVVDIFWGIVLCTILSVSMFLFFDNISKFLW